MPDVIQCPTCAKQYRLPERPPATFTCRSCGTAMDLSAFRGPAAAAPAEAPAETAPAAAAEESPHVSRTGRAGGGTASGRSSRPGRSTAVARARRRAASGGEGEEEVEGGHDSRARREKKDQTTLIVGALIGFVVIIGIAFVVVRRKEEPVKPADTAKAPEAPPPVVAPKPPAMDGAGMEGEAGMDGAGDAPKVIMGSKVQWHPVDHHPDATPEERAKIDDLIQKAVFENLGRDSRDAGHELLAYGMKAAPRLINVFSTVKAGEGFDGREGRVKASVADGLLREIDGFMDRKKRGMTKITAASEPKHADNVARTWLAWWDLGGWKSPEKPWDPRVDGNPDAESGGMDGGSK